MADDEKINFVAILAEREQMRKQQKLVARDRQRQAMRDDMAARKREAARRRARENGGPPSGPGVRWYDYLASPPRWRTVGETWLTDRFGRVNRGVCDFRKAAAQNFWPRKLGSRIAGLHRIQEAIA